jgi:UDP-N-acetylglucosamine acyltransferase
VFKIREGMIHPTAIVAEGARLGVGVSLGPYAIVEEGAEVGDHCRIGAHAVIGSSVRMGEDNWIGAGAVLGGDPQDLRFDTIQTSYLQIGSGNRIREHCTIHRSAVPGGRTEVGNENYLMVGSHLGHDVRMGDKTILANGVLVGGHATIEDGVFLGGGTLVHQSVKVGRLSISQGNTSLSKNLPPFLMASGLNAVVGLNVVGLKRAGFSSQQRSEIKEAFSWVYRRGYNLAQAMDYARARKWSADAEHFWDFIEHAGKRGICGWRGRRAGVSERDAD